MSTKSTILYERLSKEDLRENESLSIKHQKEYLEEYAIRNGFANIIHLTDAGWTGTRLDRPGFLQMMDEETWTIVQRLRQTKRKPERISGAPNPLTGILYCADCGAKMYHKKGNTSRPNQPHHEYVCSSYRRYSKTCTCHYIRVSVVKSLIL